MQDTLDDIKIVVALRTARVAIGWTQQELATRLKIAKSTVARIETMEGGIRADLLSAIVREYKKAGVELDFLFSDEVKITISPLALQLAKAQLTSQENRRSDRKHVRTTKA